MTAKLQAHDTTRPRHFPEPQCPYRTTLLRTPASPHHSPLQKLKYPYTKAKAPIEAKEVGEGTINKHGTLYPASIDKVDSQAKLPSCLRHGRPSLLTSDVVKSCLVNLANPPTFAP